MDQTVEQMIEEDIAALSAPSTDGLEREGIINPGDVDWFPAGKFHGYLWGYENAVWISLIISLEPGKGNLSKLFEAIWASGRTVKVPCPFVDMRSILQRKGFAIVDDPNCEVWARAPQSTTPSRREG